jgi:mevalonate kinase
MAVSQIGVYGGERERVGQDWCLYAWIRGLLKPSLTLSQRGREKLVRKTNRGNRGRPSCGDNVVVASTEAVSQHTFFMI